MENQRLFRLTSQSNDGVFNTLFNEDIEIAPGSEIALQSASFDRQSQIVKIDANNKRVDFGLLVDPAKRHTTNMIEGEYSQLQDGEALLASTADQMNGRIDMDEPTRQVQGDDGFLYSIDRGSQWRLQLDKDGKTAIRAKTNGPCLISNDYWVNTSPASEVTTVFAKTGTNVAPSVTAGTAGAADFISRTGGTGSTNYNQSYVYGKIPMIKGTGCVRARINDWTQTGAGLSATIGIVSDFSKLTSGTIANADILYGWQLAGNTVNYTSKQGGGTAAWVDSEIPPAFITADPDLDNRNDVLEIVIGDGIAAAETKKSINLKVHTDGGGAQGPAMDEALFPDVGTDLYYFISFARPIKLDMVEVDLDPYKFTQDLFGITQVPQSLQNTLARSAVFESGIAAIPLADREATFSFSSDDIGGFYGFLKGEPFSVVPTSIVASEDYSFISTIRPEFSVTAKNLLVLFDELPLNSYDSYSRFDVNARNANSGGSRRNLLATVPVKEDQIGTTTVTQVAFEPNTLDYISLRNNSTFLTRTLACRILTSTYQPIEVDGMASMTLLIKQHGSGSCG